MRRKRYSLLALGLVAVVAVLVVTEGNGLVGHAVSDPDAAAGCGGPIGEEASADDPTLVETEAAAPAGGSQAFVPTKNVWSHVVLPASSDAQTAAAEVTGFLDSEHPDQFRVAANWSPQSGYWFDVFTTGSAGPTGWQAQMLTDPGEVTDLLSDAAQSAADPQVSAVHASGAAEHFFVFYRSASGQTGSWSSSEHDSATDARDWMMFNAIRNARIAAFSTAAGSEYHVFYRPDGVVNDREGWRVLTADSADGAIAVAGGTAVPGYYFEIASQGGGGFTVFEHLDDDALAAAPPPVPAPAGPTGEIHVAQPLSGERFVATEAIPLVLHVPRGDTLRGRVTWRRHGSRTRGPIAVGDSATVQLAPGTHRLNVFVGRRKIATVKVRVFVNLGALFAAPMATTCERRACGSPRSGGRRRASSSAPLSLCRAGYAFDHRFEEWATSSWSTKVRATKDFRRSSWSA